MIARGVEFALDSPLEEMGFEPLVPLGDGLVVEAARSIGWSERSPILAPLFRWSARR